jgi:hypothetical protein
LSFLLLAVFTILFNACQKENFLVEQPTLPISETQDLSPTITVEEVKNWYEKTLAEQKGISSFAGDSMVLLKAEPKWDESKNGFSETTKEFLFVPIALKADQNTQFKLLTTRQLDGSITGKLVTYIPTQAYHEAKKGNYNVEDFTGTAIYTNLAGKFEYGFVIENGQYKGQAKAKRIERPGENSLQVRGCVSSTFTICVHFPDIAFQGACMYTIEVTNIICTDELPPSTAGTHGGLGSLTGTSGGSAWGSSQPSNLFTYNQIETLRTKFRSAGLDDIFYTLELNQDLLQAVNSFLDTKGWNNVNKTALQSLVNSASDYKALGEYLTTLSTNTDFYNANLALNFPSSAVTALSKYTKAGFTTQEFVYLFKNQGLFKQSNGFLSENNFNQSIVDFVKELSKEKPVLDVPGYPENHPVAQSVLNFNEFIWNAFEGSNNISTKGLHKTALGLDGGDGYSKCVGAIGEGIFAKRLVDGGTSKNLVWQGITIGAIHHDLITTIPCVKVNTTSINAGFTLKINYTDQNGNPISASVFPYRANKQGINMAVGAISYEVKTYSPNTALVWIKNGFIDGIEQAIKRANQPGCDAGVLVFDLPAFNIIKNDVAVQAAISKLATIKNQYGEQKAFLRLENNLHYEADRAFYAIKDRIKNLNP